MSPERNHPVLRLYSWMLLIYPQGFRRSYGAEMVRLFADKLAACGGGWAAIRQCGSSAVDLLLSGLAERWHMVRRVVAEIGDATRSRSSVPEPGDRWWGRGARTLAFAWRRVWRRPLFAVVAILTLGLGIGANTAIFSVVNGVILRPLPYPEADRLLYLTTDIGVSVPDAVDWRRESKTLSQIAVSTSRWDLDLTGEGPPTKFDGSTIEPEYFEVVGLKPILGRVFTEEENQVGASWVAVISEEFWHSHFGADSGVVGQTITLSDNRAEIIGVMPRAFDLAEAGIDAWLPIAPVTPWAMTERGTNHLYAIGRLAPRATLDEARAEMEAITVALEQRFPRKNADKVSRPVPLQDSLIADQRGSLFALLGAVGLVLLLACVNLATLLLVKASANESETAVRMALGCNRRQVLLLALAEGGLLALMGSAVGLGLAWGGTDFLIALAPENMPRLAEVTVDLPVLGFTALVTVGATLSFGVLPGWWTSRTDPASVIHGSTARVTRGHHRLQGLLITVEVALATVLLLGAGLMVRTMTNLNAIEVGFDGEVVTLDVSLPEARYGASQMQRQTEFFTSVVDRLNGTDGVTVAASIIGPPLSGQYIGGLLKIEGRDDAASGAEVSVRRRPVVGDYFRAMGLEIVKGRSFGPGDTPDGEPVAIINQQMAAELWPDGDPIGQRIGWVERGPVRWMRIIGVAKDTKQNDIRESDFRAVYSLYPQRTAVWQRFGSLVVRSPLPLPALRQRVQEAVAAFDPLVPIAEPVTMSSRRDLSVSREALLTRLLVAFAAVAALMSLQGIYGVLAFAVVQRRREIGIRLAVGAPAGRVFGRVLGKAAGLAAVGVSLGMMGGFVSGRLLDSLVYGVATTDLATFVVAAAAVTVVALAAALAPAWKALKTDPVEVLRAD